MKNDSIAVEKKDAVNGRFQAAFYLRLSKEDGDKEESDSIVNQRELLNSFAKNAPDIDVVSERVDDGHSGASFQRPDFQKMMEDIRAGRVNCVIVKDLSRFGRNFGEAGQYIEHVFPFLGVRFISVNDGIDTMRKKSHSDDIVIPFLNLVNDAYCRDISVKIRSQLDVKRKKGDFVGSFAVYGYRKSETDKNRLVIDDTAADIVRLIYRMKLEGHSQQGISDKLNELGVLSPMEYKKAEGLAYRTNFKTSSKAKWSAVAVGRILKDETYIGTLVQGKCATPNHKIKKKFQKPSEDWARVENAHEAIISRMDFELVNSLLSRDTRIAPGESTVYLFSGLAVCGKCHENLIRKPIEIGGKKYVYYVCTSGCNGFRISESTLTDSITAALHAHIDSILNIERILRFIDTLPLKREEVKRLDRQITGKHTEIERYRKLLFSLYENLENGIINESEYRDMKETYNALCADTERALARLSEEIEGIAACKGEKNEWIEHFKEYHDFSDMSRKLLAATIEEIVVYPKARFEVGFRYQYDYNRAISFIEAVSELHSMPGNEQNREVV